MCSLTLLRSSSQSIMYGDGERETPNVGNSGPEDFHPALFSFMSTQNRRFRTSIYSKTLKRLAVSGVVVVGTADGRRIEIRERERRAAHRFVVQRQESKTGTQRLRPPVSVGHALSLSVALLYDSLRRRVRLRCLAGYSGRSIRLHDNHPRVCNCE